MPPPPSIELLLDVTPTSLPGQEPWLGQGLRILLRTLDAATKAPIAATGVQVAVREPRSAIRVIYGTEQLTADGTGRWVLDLVATAAGRWRIRGECAGPTPAAQERVVDVRGSQVVVEYSPAEQIVTREGELLTTPDGAAIVAQRVDRLPDAGAPQAEDTMLVVRGGEAMRQATSRVLDAAAAAGGAAGQAAAGQAAASATAAAGSAAAAAASAATAATAGAAAGETAGAAAGAAAFAAAKGVSLPLAAGTAAAGAANRWAPEDHVHPTDATRAPLASPAFTGTPTAPTPAADTNTTRLATTEWVLGQRGTATPLMSGTASAGTSSRWASQDHVHPTDATRAPLNSPALITPTLTSTPASNDPAARVINIGFYNARASNAAPQPPVAGGASGTAGGFSRADHQHPLQTSTALRIATVSSVVGAVARALDRRLADMLGLTPFDFVAEGTDLTANMATGLDAAFAATQAAGGRTLRFPSWPSYRYDGRILLSENYNDIWIGEGASTNSGRGTRLNVWPNPADSAQLVAPFFFRSSFYLHIERLNLSARADPRRSSGVFAVDALARTVTRTDGDFSALLPAPGPATRVSLEGFSTRSVANASVAVNLVGRTITLSGGDFATLAATPAATSVTLSGFTGPAAGMNGAYLVQSIVGNILTLAAGGAPLVDGSYTNITISDLSPAAMNAAYAVTSIVGSVMTLEAGATGLVSGTYAGVSATDISDALRPRTILTLDALNAPAFSPSYITLESVSLTHSASPNLPPTRAFAWIVDAKVVTLTNVFCGGGSGDLPDAALTALELGDDLGNRPATLQDGVTRHTVLLNSALRHTVAYRQTTNLVVLGGEQARLVPRGDGWSIGVGVIGANFIADGNLDGRYSAVIQGSYGPRGTGANFVAGAGGWAVLSSVFRGNRWAVEIGRGHALIAANSLYGRTKTGSWTLPDGALAGTNETNRPDGGILIPDWVPLAAQTTGGTVTVNAVAGTIQRSTGWPVEMAVGTLIVSRGFSAGAAAMNNRRWTIAGRSGDTLTVTAAGHSDPLVTVSNASGTHWGYRAAPRNVVILANDLSGILDQGGVAIDDRRTADLSVTNERRNWLHDASPWSAQRITSDLTIGNIGGWFTVFSHAMTRRVRGGKHSAWAVLDVLNNDALARTFGARVSVGGTVLDETEVTIPAGGRGRIVLMWEDMLAAVEFDTVRTVAVEVNQPAGTAGTILAGGSVGRTKAVMRELPQ